MAAKCDNSAEAHEVTQALIEDGVIEPGRGRDAARKDLAIFRRSVGAVLLVALVVVGVTRSNQHGGQQGVGLLPKKTVGGEKQELASMRGAQEPGGQAVAGSGDLPPVDPNAIYPGNIHKSIPKVQSADACAKLCAANTVCVAWTWGRAQAGPWSDVCYLRGRYPKTVLTRIYDADFVSGMPTQKGRSIEIQDPTPGQSLFCFSLIIPNSYELELEQFAYEENMGIFGCDEFATYSSSEFEVAPGSITIRVNSDLKCEKGGEFGTALNTPIFFAVWDKVFEGRRHMVHDWTVKVDPDAVFFPGRLRSLVQDKTEYSSGTYLNNCAHGLHGPLEVFSKLAVESWRNGRDSCTTHFQQQCSGDCQWGEDMFIDQCLQFLNTYRVDEFNQLVEDHCDPPANWATCSIGNSKITAFHPFKTVEGYKKCMLSALAESPSA